MSNDFVTVWKKIIHINLKRSYSFISFLYNHHYLPMQGVCLLGRAHVLQSCKQIGRCSSHFLLYIYCHGPLIFITTAENLALQRDDVTERTVE